MRLLGILAFVLLACAACVSTVTPDIVAPTQASYSGSERNSGVIARTPGYWVVDGNWRARYNALIDRYGREFLPPLTHDAGVRKLADADSTPSERWQVDPQHFDDFLRMNLELHSGLAPANP